MQNIATINRKIYSIATLIESSGDTPAYIGLAAKIRFRVRNSPTLIMNDLIPILRNYSQHIENRTLTADMIRKIFNLGEEYAEVITNTIRNNIRIYEILQDILRESQL